MTGTETEVFLVGEDKVLCVNMYRGDEAIDRALTALEAARGRGVHVPAFAGPVTISGKRGILLELLDSKNLLAKLGQAPWKVCSVGRITGAAHASLNSVLGPRALPTIHDIAFHAIEQSAHAYGDRRELASRLAALPSGDRLLHCDLNPANLLFDARRRRWDVVDWGSAARGDPAADVALTLIMMSDGAVPDSTSRVVGFVAPYGRRLLIRAYMSEYLAHRAVDLRVVAKWRSLWTEIKKAKLMVLKAN
jgi:thiamine kinase-like enzyme